MIYLAAVAGLVTCGLLYQIHALQRMLLSLVASHERERAELLTRIQHPEIVPARIPEDYIDAPTPQDEFERVGSISLEIPDGN